MTNKIEISRELAERLTRRYPAEITDQETMQAIRIEALAALDELRALLAATAVEPVEVVSADNSEQALTLLDFALSFALCNRDLSGTRRDVKKARAHLESYRKFLAVERKEPVAWRMDFADGNENYGFTESKAHAEKVTADPYYKVTPLYTSPPAPVAVALPDRMAIPEPKSNLSDMDMFDYEVGFNACLDKVKEMNK